MGVSRMKIREGNMPYTLIHGHWIFYPFKGVNSIGQFHFLLAGILGVSVSLITLALKVGNVGLLRSLPWPWSNIISERWVTSTELCMVAGLQNTGNNCFLNVILQALASCGCFQTFLQNNIQEDDLVEEKLESMPLTVSLIALLRELSILRVERVVASPRKVMLAMELHITSFNLTKQQDAAEALLHLLSSLKEEFSESYIPDYGSLAAISSLPPSRISHTRGEGGQNECERWQHHIFTPFDGTLGSILICNSCSFQLSMDLEVFHCLTLSPLLDRSASIMEGCTLEDCLKKFTAVEQVGNYQCRRCCHLAAEKSLSFKMEENETKIEKLRSCCWHEGCDCKKIFMQEGIPWPTDSSYALKQLTIGRCPKILCIHLQRASLDEHGEINKLRGQISFPLLLDISPFTSAGRGMGTGIDVSQKNVQVQSKRLKQPLVPHLNYFNVQLKMPMQEHIYGNENGNIYPSMYSGDSLRKLLYRSSGQALIRPLEGEDEDSNSCLGNKTQLFVEPAFPKYEQIGMHIQGDSESGNSIQSKSCIYHLVSAVEHYGSDGNGHYAVYRRVEVGSGTERVSHAIPEEQDRELKNPDVYWFCISDSEVSFVTEQTVLASEATLLFYERVEVPI